MSTQLMIASGVEMFLMVLTFFLLQAGTFKATYRWAGTLLLCITFCWSVVLGCVLALNEISFRI